MKLNLKIAVRKPEKVFLFLAVSFGVTFVFLTPPAQSPDENRHFYRAYHMSQGSLSATRIDGRVGGFLPKKIKESLAPFSEMKGRKDIKTSRKELASIRSMKQNEKKEFVDFPSMAVYTPISYIPQAIGVRLGRLFSDSTLVALYAGRLMALLFWVLAIYYCIRITPIFKWLFVALALLPMTMYVHSSVSADVVTNAIAFLVLATLFKQAFSDQKQSNKDYLNLALLVFLLASAKFLYSPLILLFLLIPIKNAENKRQYILRFLGLGAIAALTTVIWPIVQGGGYTTYAEYPEGFREKVNVMACSDIQEQLAYIFSHGTYLFEVLFNSVVQSFDTYYKGFIGNFGWGEAPLHSFWLIFGYLGLFLIALSDGHKELRMSGTQRLLLAVPFVSIFALIIVSQLLIWTCIGGDVVQNLQGRYFIPIAPLLFFMAYRSKDTFQKYLPFGVILFSLSLLIASTTLIYNRFYVPLEYASETITCDHEGGEGTADFTTSKPGYFAQNGFSRSKEKVRSGQFSSKLSPSCLYGTYFKFENCSDEDIIEMEGWRHGPNGMAVVSSETGEKLFIAIGDAEETSNGWEKVKLSIRIPPTMHNETVACYFGYFGSADSCYIDDVKVTLHRVKQ